MTLADLLYVTYFAAIGPLIDYAFFWPAFRRRIEADPARARIRMWAWSIGSAWVLVAIGAAIWIGSGRSWASFGFSVPEGWRLWTATGVVLLAAAYYALAVISVARSPETRASVRQQGGAFSEVLPHTRTDVLWFSGVSLTAGFCEEFLFRGYFIAVLSPWLGWWGAAALSLLLFAGWHAYQGWSGVVRTAVFGAIFTLAVAAFDSLWPAIALHALVDLSGGIIAWLALREAQDTESMDSIVNA